MPKYYCASVRKAHNAGKNHILNVRNYYAEISQDKAQAIINEITRAYENASAVLPPQYAGYPQFGSCKFLIDHTGPCLTLFS
ncbi:hypothetical protein G6F56_008610 [Rhizopus delemar]|nr:hypothetical protein G6F56_008610 [Rhizopus delemar]